MLTQPMSAPTTCPACGDTVRRVVDVDAHADLRIDAAAVGEDTGNVHVIQVATSTGLWFVEVLHRPGPPGPPDRWHTTVPPAMFRVHACPLDPSMWPEAKVELELVGT